MFTTLSRSFPRSSITSLNTSKGKDALQTSYALIKPL
jgi:hypothetical protein